MRGFTKRVGIAVAGGVLAYGSWKAGERVLPTPAEFDAMRQKARDCAAFIEQVEVRYVRENELDTSCEVFADDLEVEPYQLPAELRAGEGEQQYELPPTEEFLNETLTAIDERESGLWVAPAAGGLVLLATGIMVADNYRASKMV